MIVLVLLGCSTELGRVPNASRLGESATGELIVGTTTGALYEVSSYGDVTLRADGLGAAVLDVASDPLGGWWVLLADGRLVALTPWTPPKDVAVGVLGVLRTCDALEYGTADAPSEWTAGGVVALGTGCSDRHRADLSGDVDGVRVSDHPVVRLAAIDDGFLWVDSEGAAGCSGCDVAVPDEPVVDAIPLHSPPSSRERSRG